MADDDPKPWEQHKTPPPQASQAKPWEQHNAPPPPAAPPPDQFQLMSEKPPVNARFPWAGRKGYTVADFLANAMPPLGAWGGAWAAAPLAPLAGPAAPLVPVAGAGLGAAGMTAAQRLIHELMYKDVAPETTGETLTSMGEQGALGAFSEGQAQVINMLTKPLMRGFGMASQAVKDAKAGRDIRLLPGEASNWPMLKLTENVVGHWPGGAGEIEEFRAAQEADINKRFAERLQDLSKRDLSPEEAGKEIQNALREAKGQLDPGVEADRTQAETTHENRSQGLVDEQLNRLSPRQTSQEELGKQLQSQLRDQKAEIDATTERDVQRLRETQRADLDSAFTGDLNALNPVTGTTSEQAGAAIQGNLGAQQDVAHATLRTNLDRVRMQQQTDVTKVLDQQSHALSPQQLTSEESGLQVQKVLRDQQLLSKNAVDAKYDQVKVKVGRTAGTYVPAAELDAAAEEVPEAKTLLEEAKLLRVQDAQRFDVPIVKQVLTKPPEEISSMLATAPLEDLRTLGFGAAKGYLPPQIQQSAARELWESMVKQATRRGVIGTDSLANQLKTLGADRGQLIFGKNWDTIVRSADTIDGINAAADRAAGQYTTQANAPFSNKLTRDILSKSPAEVGKLMMTASPQDLTALKASIPPDMYNAAARDVLQRIISPPTSGIVTEKTLAKGMAELGPERGRLIFGDRYDSITQSMGRFNQINQTAEASAAQVLARPSPFSEHSLYQNIVETNKPEQIVSKVRAAGLDELRQLTGSLTPEMQQDFRRTVLESILERPNVRDPNGIINEKNFAKELQKLNDGGPRGQIIFGDQYQGLVETSQKLASLNEKATAARTAIEGRTSRYDAGLMKQIIATDNPRFISQFMTNASEEQLHTLMTELPPQVREAAARNTLEHFISPAREPEKFGTDELDPIKLSESLNEALKKLGPDRGRAVFGKAYDNLVQISARLRQVGFSESEMMGKMHTAGIITGVFGAVTGATTGALIHGAPGAALGLLAGSGISLGGSVGLAKLTGYVLTHPEGSYQVLRGLRLLQLSIARGEPFVVNQIFGSSPAIYPEPDITDELRQFQIQGPPQ